MALYRHTGVSVESYVEMEADVPMHYEVDHLNEQATLHCGTHGEYVLLLGRANLAEFVTVAGKAMAELDAPEEPAVV